MSALDTLQAEAEEACKFRGHILGKWNIYHGEARSYSNNECTECGAWVQCDTSPLPNGINIGGPAVAIGCDEAKKELLFLTIAEEQALATSPHNRPRIEAKSLPKQV